MKAKLSPWLCGALLVAVLPLAGQQPPIVAKETTEARIERLLRELDAPRFKVRDRAMGELRELGDKAVAPQRGIREAGPHPSRAVHPRRDEAAGVAGPLLQDVDGATPRLQRHEGLGPGH